MNIDKLSRKLAQASRNSQQPLTINSALFVIRTLTELMTDELIQPDGKVEIENFLVLQNKPYNQTGLHTRRIELRVSPNLKKRLRANMPK